MNQGISTSTAYQQPAGKKASVVDLIKYDHGEIRRLLDLASGKTTMDLIARQDALNKAVALISEHAVAEEILLYPAIRKTAKDAVLADRSLGEHQRIKELTQKIRKVSPTDPIFAPILTGPSLSTSGSSPRVPDLTSELTQCAMAHIGEEESKVLPELQMVVAESDLITMGDHFLTAKKYAPIEPHPGAPNAPPGNVILAPVTAFVDKLKRVVTGESKTPA